MIIYKISNRINKKLYIGLTTVNMDKRWKEHCRNKNIKNSLIARAIQKHGKENFMIEKIDEAKSMLELNEREIHHICDLNTISPNGYNLKSGGNGHIIHPSTRIKLSKARKGKVISKEHKKAIAKAHSIAVFQYDLKGVFIKNWYSASEAGRILNISNSEISKCCKGTRKSCGNYMWSFTKKEKIEEYKIKKYVAINRKSTNTKKVSLLDDNGNIIKTYNSITEAGLANNCDVSTIAKICKGKSKYKKVKKLTFIYA